MNYYNEHNKHAAQWLRNLIAGGIISPGYVDDRSIEDVHTNDLRGPRFNLRVGCNESRNRVDGV